MHQLIEVTKEVSSDVVKLQRFLAGILEALKTLLHKVDSSGTTNFDCQKKLVSTGKPIFISTRMCNLTYEAAK